MRKLAFRYRKVREVYDKYKNNVAGEYQQVSYTLSTGCETLLLKILKLLERTRISQPSNSDFVVH